MRFIGYNIVPICLLAIAALLIWKEMGGWGWCVFGAIISAVYPTTEKGGKE
jgi:hypothetical protein